MSDAQAATLLNVSEKSVERAKAVKREAVPEVVKLVEDGKLAVSAAAAVAKAAPTRQKRVAAKVKEGKRAQAANGLSTRLRQLPSSETSCRTANWRTCMFQR